MHEPTLARRAREATVVRKKVSQHPHRRRRVSPMPSSAPEDSETASSSSSSASSSGAEHEQHVLPNDSDDFYAGQRRGGAPHGSGKYLQWTDGRVYDTYTGAAARDASAYRGTRSVNLKHGRQSYGNGGDDRSSPTARDPRDVFARDDFVTGRSTESATSPLLGDEADGEEEMPPVVSPAPHITQRVVAAPPEAKAKPKGQGETIAKGHKNYELMLNLQLGIRHAVGRQGPIMLDLKPPAFDPTKQKYSWTKFPPQGSKCTPSHVSCEFRWKDYSPQVFRTLRELFKVDAADYMLSLCGNEQALRKLPSPGKSGSFFYLTNDDRYMIKTIKKSEAKTLLKMLPAYYNHVREFENTLVTKFFGLHCVKLAGANQKKVRFVVMGNLFCSEYSIHRRFDLKGSSLGRTITGRNKPRTTEIDDQYTTLKDLDLNFIFRLKKQWFQEFKRQLDVDCKFLEQETIMDYSLLVGVHFIDDREKLLAQGSIDCDISNISTHCLSRGRTERFPAEPPNRCPNKPKLGTNTPARAELITAGRRKKSDDDRDESRLVGGEPPPATTGYYDVTLYLGIIDVLQGYGIGKKLEHAYKSLRYDSTSVSAVDPRQYSRRFRDFMHKAFQEDDI